MTNEGVLCLQWKGRKKLETKEIVWLWRILQWQQYDWKDENAKSISVNDTNTIRLKTLLSISKKIYHFKYKAQVDESYNISIVER